MATNAERLFQQLHPEPKQREVAGPRHGLHIDNCTVKLGRGYWHFCFDCGVVYLTSVSGSGTHWYTLPDLAFVNAVKSCELMQVYRQWRYYGGKYESL